MDNISEISLNSGMSKFQFEIPLRLPDEDKRAEWLKCDNNNNNNNDEDNILNVSNGNINRTVFFFSCLGTYG